MMACLGFLFFDRTAIEPIIVFEKKQKKTASHFPSLPSQSDSMAMAACNSTVDDRSTAKEFLENHQPTNGNDLRDWGWYWLRNQAVGDQFDSFPPSTTNW
jgi:hypothetical protein